MELENAKKKRAFTTVACERCRKMKQACDGTRPVCGSCTKRGAVCKYERDTLQGETRQAAMKRELDDHKSLLDGVKDALDLLKTASHAESLTILEHLKSADRPVDALADLPNWITRNAGPSNLSISKAASSSRWYELSTELATKHVTSYPLLLPTDQMSTPFGIITDQRLLYASSVPQPSIGQSAPIQSIKTPTGLHIANTHGHVFPITSSSDLSLTRSYYNDSQLPQGQASGTFLHVTPTDLVDDKLRHFNAIQWTHVPISNELAARMISLYLKLDHPLLGFFDPDLFLDSLINASNNYCSPLLLSGLLAWTCQAYGAELGQSMSEYKRLFVEEAEATLSQSRHEDDSAIMVAGRMVLAMTFSCDGRDQDSERLKKEMVEIGQRLALFNASPAEFEQRHGSTYAHASNSDYRANAFIAWGAYSWISFHCAYYGEVPIHEPPRFALPSDLPYYMGHTFPAVCRLRVVASRFSAMYRGTHESRIAKQNEVNFAEQCYGQLLTWADGLDPLQQRTKHCLHHVTILHIWYHIVILDLFRPFVGKNVRLQMFDSPDSTPETICEASLAQLKCLVIGYRRSQRTAHSSILWHLALLYIANALLGSTRDAETDFYWNECVDAYLLLFNCFRLAAGFLQGLVVIAVERNHIDGHQARDILAKLAERAHVLQVSTIMPSTHVVDLDTALTNRPSAQIDRLASKLDLLVIGNVSQDDDHDPPDDTG